MSSIILVIVISLGLTLPSSKEQSEKDYSMLIVNTLYLLEVEKLLLESLTNSLEKLVKRVIAARSLIKMPIQETEKYLPHAQEYLSHPVTVYILIKRMNYDNWTLFRSYIMRPLVEESTNGWIRIQSTYPLKSEQRPLKSKTIQVDLQTSLLMMSNGPNKCKNIKQQIYENEEFLRSTDAKERRDEGRDVMAPSCDFVSVSLGCFSFGIEGSIDCALMSTYGDRHAYYGHSAQPQITFTVYGALRPYGTSVFGHPQVDCLPYGPVEFLPRLVSFAM
uniref:Prolyl 4-hydroxylase N-terminal domain-containing protein n=1 Tax=Glossina pallidipes TaxID=7398 RepID=A0A1A9ZRE1_GLOPL